MQYPEFVAALAKPLPTQLERLEHALYGVIGEVGELADAYKKHIIYGKPLDQENVIEELGDIRFYMQMIINEGIGFQDIPDARPPRPGVTPALFYAAGITGLMALEVTVVPNDVATSQDFSGNLTGLLQTWKILCEEFGTTPEHVIEVNVAKLSKRYPNISYSNEDAIARADKN